MAHRLIPMYPLIIAVVSDITPESVTEWVRYGFGFQLAIEGVSLIFLCLRLAKNRGHGWLSGSD